MDVPEERCSQAKVLTFNAQNLSKQVLFFNQQPHYLNNQNGRFFFEQQSLLLICE
jgi:hypothetical protein